MDVSTPEQADAFRRLRDDIYGYLDEAEFLALKLTDWTDEDAESARALIPDLVTIVRAIVLDHRETGTGACSTCTTAWPCSAVRTIHGLVCDPQHEFVRIAQRAAAA